MKKIKKADIAEKTIRDKKIYYKKILGYFAKQKKAIVIYMLTALILTGFSTITPLISAKLLTAITTVELNQIIYASLILVGINFIESIVSIFNRENGQIVQDYVSLEIKTDVTTELFNLETANFDKEGTGFFSSRINSEPNSIAGIFSKIRHSFTEIFTSLGFLIYMFIVNYKIGILFLIFSVVIFFIRKKQIKRWEKNYKQRNKLHEKYSSSFTEIVRGIRDIKVLNLKSIMVNRVVDEQKDITKGEITIRKSDNRFDTISWGLRDLMDFAILAFAVYLVFKGEIAGTSLIIIYMYKTRAFYFVTTLTDIYDSYKQFNLSLERLYEVTDGLKYKKEEFGNASVSLKGNIKFKNVKFAYKEQKVLKGISFEIKENETIGFVGKSGQGKSTVFNLISKLYRVKDNQIFMDGVDINDLDENSIRESISVITQSPYIFDMTIKENLKIVNPEMSDEEMIEKCKLCALHDFVETLEDKYDTKLGEGGVILSGGQRQRLAIARSLMKNSKIILLDEATSSLDNETQNYIQESIRKISSNYTILMIAHRLSTVKDCDKIIVIEDGKIAGIGNHKTLIKENEVYKNLYKKELV